MIPMAQYLISVLDETAGFATDEEMAAIDVFNEQLTAEGHWVFVAGFWIIVRLNRAIAVAELDGPEVAMAEVDGLPLDGYHAFHATRAELLRRLGRSEESRAAYDRAIELAGNTAETAYLTRRRNQLAGRVPPRRRSRSSGPRP
jgi:predicted RNA polymerase sigma factor